MTRAAALKKVIRARAAKTGERYTTARRHVLNELQQRTGTSARAKHGLPEGRPYVTSAAASQSASGAISKGSVSEATSETSKGSVSDATSLARTGHELAHWFDVLDRFGAVEKGHTAAARHLSEAHRVAGWYAQGITVAYERARGVRALNQRGDGAYEVSVSKVVAGSTADVVKAFTKTERRRWMKGVDTNLTKALAAALDTPASKGFVVRPDSQGRFRYKWNGTTVQFYLLPKAGNRLSVVVTNTNLPTGATVDERRSQWRAALNALAARLAR